MKMKNENQIEKEKTQEDSVIKVRENE